MDAHQSDLFTNLSPAAHAWYTDHLMRLVDRFGTDQKAIVEAMTALTVPHALSRLEGLPHDALAAEVASAFQRAGIERMIRQWDAVNRLLPGAADEEKTAYLDLIDGDEA